MTSGIKFVMRRRLSNGYKRKKEIKKKATIYKPKEKSLYIPRAFNRENKRLRKSVI